VPWISTEWLSEVLFAVAYSLGGFRAVAILGSITCTGIIAALAWFLIGRMRFSIAVGWTALTAFAISGHYFARPHLFSYVLTVLWLAVLVDCYDSDAFGWKSLIRLSPAIAIWANLHGSFSFALLLLFVFAGCSLIDSARRFRFANCREIAIVTFIAACFAFLTPYGWQPVGATFDALKLSSAAHNLNEMRSPNFHDDIVRLVEFLCVLAGLLAAGIRLRGPRRVTFICITGMALSYTRGLFIFFLALPIIMANPLTSAVPSLLPEQPFSTRTGPSYGDEVLEWLRRNALKVFFASAALAVMTVPFLWLRPVAPPESIFPRAALDFLKRENISGNVFNHYNFGGALIFSGIPTFIDGRALPFTNDFMTEYFDALNLVNLSKAFALLDRYNVDVVMLKPGVPLDTALAVCGRWKKSYSDEAAVIYVRRGKFHST
jgi:hypothetical protein